MIDIAVMGPTRIRVDGRRVTLAGVKPRRLLQMLAAELGEPISKDALAEGLWDGRPPASYVASVESYACVIRRALAVAAGGPALVTTRRGYLLDPDQVRVDLVEVRRLLESVLLCTGETLLSGAEEVLHMTRRRLFADEPFAPFARELRDNLDAEVENVLIVAAEHALDDDQAGRALTLGRAVHDRSPLSEPAARAVMGAHRAQGARAQALTVYADLRALMLDEVGVEPCERTRLLYQQVLDDAGRTRPRERDEVEVSTLARLLRETLEAGVRLDPANWAWLKELSEPAASQLA